MDSTNFSFALVLFLQLLFGIGAVVQFYFYFFVYLRLAIYRKEEENTAKPPVSVIIAARHEAKNLKKNLPGILAQNYPDYEVIVVDDGSRDNSLEILEAFQNQHPHLRIVKGIGDEHAQGGKKLALTLGIKAAANDRLLFTDADCYPQSANWIATMIAASENTDNIILGYSPYEKEKGFLNRLIRFETFYTAVNYFSFALMGNPYMGVGRNLSYSKADFFRISGFKKHYSLAMGDDDLFVNEVATATNTKICIEAASQMISEPKKTWSAYWFQKRRHLYSSHRYKTIHKILLLLQPLSYFAFVLAVIGLLVINSWMYIVLLTLTFRLLLQFFIFRRISHRFGQANNLFLAAILELVVIIMSGILHIANATAKPKKWRN